MKEKIETKNMRGLIDVAIFNICLWDLLVAMRFTSTLIDDPMLKSNDDGDF